jgi:hypothetical protein
LIRYLFDGVATPWWTTDNKGVLTASVSMDDFIDFHPDYCFANASCLRTSRRVRESLSSQVL